MRKKPIIMVTDYGTVSWSELDDPGNVPDDPAVVNGGWLLGPKNLVEEVKETLFGENAPVYSQVAWSSYKYSKDRSQVSDVVVAMYNTGHGRGLLNKEGWEIINKAMPELTAPENNRDDVIY